MTQDALATAFPISASQGGDENAIACNKGGAAGPVCVAAFMRPRDGTGPADGGTTGSHNKCAGLRIAWNHGDPYNLSAWANTHQNTESANGWGRVAHLSSATNITRYGADPSIVAIPRAVDHFPPASLSALNAPPNPAVETPLRFAAQANACGDLGPGTVDTYDISGIGFSITDDGGQSWGSSARDVSQSTEDGDRDKSFSAVDEETGAVWVFYSVGGDGAGAVPNRYARWMFKAGPGSASCGGQPCDVLRQAAPMPLPAMTTGQMKGHVSMAVAHRQASALTVRTPVVFIAQTDSHLNPCTLTLDQVTWSVIYHNYLGTASNHNPNPSPSAWTGPVVITQNTDFRNCAGTDPAAVLTGDEESGGDYKINSLPHMVSLEDDTGAALFVAFPETAHSGVNAGYSQIHLWSARYDKATNTILGANSIPSTAWHDSIVSTSEFGDVRTNQWRPTLSIVKGVGTNTLAVQWLEATGQRNPYTVSGAAFAVLNASQAAGNSSVVWVGSVTRLTDVYNYGENGHGVDYSKSAAILPSPGHANGGVIFEWPMQFPNALDFSTLYASTVSF